MAITKPTDPTTFSASSDKTNEAVTTLVSTTLPSLSSTSALERNQATHKFKTSLTTLNNSSLLQISTAVTTLLTSLTPTHTWQQHAGALLAASALLPHHPTLSPHARQGALSAITHAEPRVRAAAAALLADASRAEGGVTSWDATGTLLAVARSRFDIGADARLAEAGRIAAHDSNAPNARHNTAIIHETEGWRGLETALLALRGVVDGCARQVLAPYVTVDDVPHLTGVLSAVTRARAHENRFVREAGLRLYGALVTAAPVAMLAELGELGKDTLADGLQDNWSQVRYAASECARSLLASLSEVQRRMHYKRLLPRMCLNRHYVAEGVRTLSQATWRDVIGKDGRVFLEEELPAVITFYESQCQADNHAVREAACQSLGEAATRLDKTPVRALVTRIVAALVECCKDESWPVRDHACRALADVVAAFPNEAEQSGRLLELYQLLHDHLADNIPSVRDNCAAALVRAASAFPIEHAVLGLRRVSAAATALLARADKQQEHVPADAPHRHTGYGAAAKLARDNDVDLHSGQVMYSCGSLAPKLRRGGGCMDHGFSRPRQPWEEADGGARLWRRIAHAGSEGAMLAGDALHDVAKAAAVAADTPFTQQAQFAESVWTQIAAGVSKIGAHSWTTPALKTLVQAMEKDRKCGHRRVEAAAASASRAVRASAGAARYDDAKKAAAGM